MSVVLPASGWEMIAKVRRLATSRDDRVSTAPIPSGLGSAAAASGACAFSTRTVVISRGADLAVSCEKRVEGIQVTRPRAGPPVGENKTPEGWPHPQKTAGFSRRNRRKICRWQRGHAAKVVLMEGRAQSGHGDSSARAKQAKKPKVRTFGSNLGKAQQTADHWRTSIKLPKTPF